jgi:hypothetical protein
MISKLKLTVLSFSLMSISPTILAQNYAGTIGDLNTIFDPPMNINNILCDIHVNTGNEHAYKACSDGVSAARWMAEKYAVRTGKYLGCLDGFYQGINDGYAAGKNPTQEMLKAAQTYVGQANFTSASARGLDRARAEGVTESADQIIQRYRSVVGMKDAKGRPVLPNKEYNYPQVTFNGFDDGYEYDILKELNSEFEAVYRSGWVTKSSPFEDRLAARRALALQKEYANSFCNQTDTIFGRRNMPVVSLWDFFRANRQYNFQNYGWRNPDWAWEIFDKDERTLEQYKTFQQLRNLEKTVTETIAIKEQKYKLDANNQPIPKKDANGAVIPGQFEMEEVITGYRNETRRVKLSETEVQALANIYIKGFKESYDRYYAKQYASKSYHQEGLDKYKVATIIGKSMGEDVAQHVARRNAYNNQYKLQSAKKYAEEVKNIYTASFDRLIDIFQRNPVIELNEARVVGVVEDSIFRPGEELKVQFSVTNLGEETRASSMSFESSADLNSNNQGYIFTAPILDRSEFTSSVLGRVSESKEVRSSIALGMRVSNPGDLAEVARSLVVRKGQNITINEYAEINKVSGNLNFLTGSLETIVDVVNPATTDSQLISVVELNLGKNGYNEKNVAPISAKSSTRVAVDINQIDPLAIIVEGGVRGSASIKVANKTVQKQSVSYEIPVGRKVALSLYFDALATKRSTNSGSESREDRLAKLISMLDIFVRESIEANVTWKKEVGQTVIADIQAVYRESQNAGRITKEAQDIYDQLGKSLAQRITDRNFRGGGFLGSPKKNKQHYLQAIATFAKVSTKVKDY